MECRYNTVATVTSGPYVSATYPSHPYLLLRLPPQRPAPAVRLGRPRPWPPPPAAAAAGPASSALRRGRPRLLRPPPQPAPPPWPARPPPPAAAAAGPPSSAPHRGRPRLRRPPPRPARLPCPPPQPAPPPWPRPPPPIDVAPASSARRLRRGRGRRPDLTPSPRRNQTEETGVGLVRWILADESDPDLSRIFPSRSDPTPSNLHPNIRKRGSTHPGWTLPFNQTHG